MGVPFVDMSVVHGPLREQLLAAFASVLESGRFIQGPEVVGLEGEVAAYLGCVDAVGVSSGTDALLMALMALDVGPGDEVVTTPYSFVATAEVIARVGARPVFVDIDPATFNLDPSKLDAAISSCTKAIIVVHLYGRSADMDAIGAVAERRGVPIIEDAAQAIGAEWEGRRVGGIGRLGCFSFFPTKNLGCMGDGGMVTVQDEAVAARIRQLRVHGMKEHYRHVEVGGNFRLDALQAAILRVKLPELDGWTARRQENAARYRTLFQAAGLEGVVGLPDPGPYRAVWNQYVVRVTGGRRDAVRASLAEARIGCAVYYPIPLHRQPCFDALGYRDGSMPEAERASRETLALPIAPGLTAAQQELVVATVARALAS